MCHRALIAFLWIPVWAGLGCTSRETDAGPQSTDGGASDDTQASLARDTGEGIVDDGRIWPGEEWTVGVPEEHGMDSAALEALREYAFSDGFNTQSVIVIKDGVLLAEWMA